MSAIGVEFPNIDCTESVPLRHSYGITLSSSPALGFSGLNKMYVLNFHLTRKMPSANLVGTYVNVRIDDVVYTQKIFSNV